MRSVYSHRGRFLMLWVLLVVLAGCGAAPSGETDTDTSASPRGSPDAGQQPAPVTDMNSLIAALQGNGLTVKTAGTVAQPFFDVEGTQLQVEGADVQVFEFADAEAATAAVAMLGPDGNPPTMITWVAPPHFYQAGRLVVLYVGDDAAMTHALTDVLGAQVAGR